MRYRISGLNADCSGVAGEDSGAVAAGGAVWDNALVVEVANVASKASEDREGSRFGLIIGTLDITFFRAGAPGRE